MRRFILDTHGSSYLLAAFLVIVLCLLSVVIYSVIMIYSNYHTAYTELERTAIVTTDENMLNPNVRDLEFDIPETALEDIEGNLISSGLQQSSDGVWNKYTGQELVYKLNNLAFDVHDECLDISGKFVMPLPWSFTNQTEITIPINVRTKVIYIN